MAGFFFSSFVCFVDFVISVKFLTFQYLATNSQRRGIPYTVSPGARHGTARHGTELGATQVCYGSETTVQMTTFLCLMELHQRCTQGTPQSFNEISS